MQEENTTPSPQETKTKTIFQAAEQPPCYINPALRDVLLSVSFTLGATAGFFLNKTIENITPEKNIQLAITLIMATATVINVIRSSRYIKSLLNKWKYNSYDIDNSDIRTLFYKKQLAALLIGCISTITLLTTEKFFNIY